MPKSSLWRQRNVSFHFLNITLLQNNNRFLQCQRAWRVIYECKNTSQIGRVYHKFIQLNQPINWTYSLPHPWIQIQLCFDNSLTIFEKLWNLFEFNLSDNICILEIMNVTLSSRILCRMFLQLWIYFPGT